MFFDLLVLDRQGKFSADVGGDYQDAGVRTAHRAKQMGVVAQSNCHLVFFQELTLVLDAGVNLPLVHKIKLDLGVEIKGMVAVNVVIFDFLIKLVAQFALNIKVNSHV